MGVHMDKRIEPEDLSAQLGIYLCDYQSQQDTGILTELNSKTDLVACTASHTAYPTVYPHDILQDNVWLRFLSTISSNLSKEDEDKGEKSIESILHSIVEHSQELLPLLNLLSAKAKSDESISHLLSNLQENLNISIELACSLAPREVEVLELASRGNSNTQIAEILNIQVITVGKTLTRVYKKLKARNRSDAVYKWLSIRGK